MLRHAANEPPAASEVVAAGAMSQGLHPWLMGATPAGAEGLQDAALEGRHSIARGAAPGFGGVANRLVRLLSGPLVLVAVSA